MTNELFVNSEFYVAGLQFHQYEDVKDNIKEGTLLRLVPDPLNEYDPNAVRIVWYNTMLGFVPAKTGEAKLVASALNAGKELEAKVTKNDIEAEKPWRKLKVWVKERSEASEEVQDA